MFSCSDERLFENIDIKQSEYVVYANFETLELKGTGLFITSTGFEKIVVSSYFKKGGLFRFHKFQARIINNQIGQNFTYDLPEHFLEKDETIVFDIPKFTLQALYNKNITVEYTVWSGEPNHSELLIIEIYKL